MTDAFPNGQAVPSASSSIGWAGRGAIICYGLIMGIVTTTISVVLPQIQAEFGSGLQGRFVMMAMTALGLGMLVGSPLGGALADRWGYRRVIILTSAISGIAGLAIVFVHSLFELIALRFVVGLVIGALSAAMIAVIGISWTGRQRDRWMGGFTAIAGFSLILFNPLAGLLARQNWRAAFFLYGVALLITLFAWIDFRYLPAGTGQAAPGQARQRPSRPVQTIILGMIAGTISAGPGMYAPFVLRNLGIGDPAMIGTYMLAIGVTAGLAALAYSTVRRFCSIPALFVIASALCTIGLIVMITSATLIPMLIGMMSTGLGAGFFLPNLWSHAVAISHAENKGATAGLMKGATFGGPFISQIPLEEMAHIGGASWALALVASLSALLAVWMALSIGMAKRASPA